MKFTSIYLIFLSQSKYLKFIFQISIPWFEYQKDLKTIDAVERRLSIIGEALNKAIKLNSQLNVSNKIRIVGLRHLLVHNYDLSDDVTICTIIQKHLPLLQKEIELLLKGYNGSSIN